MPRRALVYLSFFSAWFIVGGGVASSQDVVVSFALRQSAVSLHEPVLIEFSIHDGLTEAIQFDLGHNRRSNFQFTITKPGGRRVQVPRLSEGGLGLVGRLSLEPGGEYTQKLLLDEWYQFSEPGNYKVEAKLVDRIETLAGMRVRTRLSEQIPLNIQPRNPNRLNEVCRSLARSVIESPTFEARAEAASTLSYVRDLVAVPYLGRVAREGGPLAGTAIKGLARVANVEGLERVMRDLNPSDPKLESSIKLELRYIQLGLKVTD